MSASGHYRAPEPFRAGVAISPHDSNNLARVADAIFVGGGGNATIVLEDGSTIAFNGLVAGQIYHLRVRRVNSSSLTASNLLALYY